MFSGAKYNFKLASSDEDEEADVDEALLAGLLDEAADEAAA